SSGEFIPIAIFNNSYSISNSKDKIIFVRIQHPNFEPQTLTIELGRWQSPLLIHLGKPGALYMYGNGVRDAIKTWPKIVGIRTKYEFLPQVRTLLDSLRLVECGFAGGQILLAKSDHDFTLNSSFELDILSKSTFISWAGPPLAYSDAYFLGIATQFQFKIQEKNKKAFFADIKNIPGIRSTGE